jgi:hypothetical protein
LSAAEPDKVIKQWTFDRPGDLEGWEPNSHLKPVKVADGVVSCQAVNSDPMFILKPLINIPATPWQFVEFKLKADRDGTCELYWSNTDQGKFGGFSAEKTTHFSVRGDGQWHVYRFLPFWHPEKKIVRLRFDLFSEAQYQWDYLKIGELGSAPTATQPEYAFQSSTAGWRVFGEGSLRPGAEALEFEAITPGALLLSPPLQLNSEDYNYLSFEMTAPTANNLTVLYATDQQRGWQKASFPLIPSSASQIHNLDLLASANWKGRILALALQPGGSNAAPMALKWLKLSDRPQGPARLEIVSAASDEALPRVGRPFGVIAQVRNVGGEAANKVEGKLELPSGMEMIGATSVVWDQPLINGEVRAMRWQVKASKPVKGPMVIKLTSASHVPVVHQASLIVTESPKVPPSDYVPMPQPVRGKVEVGAYYFPGWNSASRWQPLQTFPERKPVLGWYSEGSPEVADWHIKYAVEHGITFFAYDWYWNKGQRHLEHGIHEGYFKSRYRNLLKFCLLWANHNPPNTSSPADCLDVTRFWLTNYFKQPEYLKVDGKPVIIIFSEYRLSSDLGAKNVKGVFETMRAECRKAGLPGLYLIACVGSASDARKAAEQGYDAVSAYNWPRLGAAPDDLRAPFDDLLGGYRKNWQAIADGAAIPIMLPICGGWDSRPWHGEKALARYGRNPENFKAHLRDAQKVLESPGSWNVLQNFALIEAWNEWGEGSYIEPHQEFGFGYLDAIREVFANNTASHQDLAPADVGRKSLELDVTLPNLTEWNFNQTVEGWESPMQITDSKAEQGMLVGKSTGPDPAWFSPTLRAAANEYSSIVLRLKLQPLAGQSFADKAQLFWRTATQPESESSSLRFEVQADGQWHEYRLPVGQSNRWRGVITRLRLDPCNRAEVSLAMDYLKLQRN